MSQPGKFISNLPKFTGLPNALLFLLHVPVKPTTIVWVKNCHKIRYIIFFLQLKCRGCHWFSLVKIKQKENTRQLLMPQKLPWINSFFQAESGFWLPFQSVNFLFLPTHLRTAFVSIGAFAWSNVLCYIKAGVSADLEIDKSYCLYL